MEEGIQRTLAALVRVHGRQEAAGTVTDSSQARFMQQNLDTSGFIVKKELVDGFAQRIQKGKIRGEEIMGRGPALHGISYALLRA